jgi:excisionase family DNA binding protein
LTYRQAADYSGYSEQHLRSLIKGGNLPASKSTPARSGRIRIKRADLDAMLESSRITIGAGDGAV